MVEVSKEEAQTIAYTVMAVHRLRKIDQTVTLPGYVRAEIEHLARGAERFKHRAETALPNAASYMLKQSERLNRNACMLITLRAKFASWRG